MSTEKASQEPVMINVGAERSGSHVIAPQVEGYWHEAAARDKKIVWFLGFVFYETLQVVYNYNAEACGGPRYRRGPGVSYVVSREVYKEIGEKFIARPAAEDATIPMDLEWNRMWYWASGIEDWYKFMAAPWKEAEEGGHHREHFTKTAARLISIIQAKLDNWDQARVYCDAEDRIKDNVYKKKLLYMVENARALVQAVEQLAKKKWGEHKKLELEMRARSQFQMVEEKHQKKKDQFIKDICYYNSAVHWNLILAPRIASWTKQINSNYLKSHIPSLEDRSVLRKNDLFRICKHSYTITFANEQIVRFVEGLVYHHQETVKTSETVEPVEPVEAVEQVPPEVLAKFWEDLKKDTK